ncbi:MAG TPA: RNA polymerase sigma factor [Isosphaeraceae bacterium]
MASGQFAVACHQIGRLFGAGTTAGLSEGQLLDRFVARRDGAAFEAIVARHGPMVLSVCRSLLRDSNDVDDAFQATFLVLVRKAETLRRRDLLGGWLYAVAGRVARRARYEASRRRDREAKYPATEGWAEPEADRLDFRAAVHAEVDRLPESYRLAVLFCDLQGHTHEEAARELGWPVGTVKGRLSRARALLRDRLARRGMAPVAGAVAALLADEGRAAVPEALFESTASAASAIGTGSLTAAAAVVSSRAIGLTQGVLTTMTTTSTRLKLAATTLMVAALAGPGASAYQFGGMGGPNRNPGVPMGGPAHSSAQARIKVAEKAIATLQELEKHGATPANYDKLFLWQQRLAEAKIEAGVPPAEATKPYLEALRAAEAKLKDRVSSGSVPQSDVDEAEYRRLKAESLVQGQGGMGMGMGGMAGMQGMGGMPGGMMGGAGPGMGGMGGGQPGMPAGGGGAMGGGFGTDAGADPEPPRKLRRQHPADLERNKLIEARLEKPVVMSFANETPLEDVLKYIKEATKDEKGKTIPIYINPIGLQNAEKTMTSAVKLDLEDIPLRTTLRLLLEQLDLDYRIRDGMLYISDQNSLQEDDHFIIPDPSEPAGAEGVRSNPAPGTPNRLPNRFQ